MTSPKSKAATAKFVAEMCKGSYYQFLLEFWSTVVPEKLQPSWYIRKLCDELQVLSERVFRDEYKEYDLIWNCPPGTTKSTVVSVLWQPWVWTRMPSARFISGSYSERLALDLSRKSRDVVLSDRYQSLFPDIQLRDDQNTKGYFANRHGGIRYAVGVGGSVIGMHAHFIAVDDPIDPQGALSDLILADANAWMTETLSRRKVHVMLTPTVLIMQRLHQDDPTGNALERGNKVRHCSIPCDTTWEVKPPEFKEFYEDGLLSPQRLPQQALDEAYRELGEAGYAGQYGQAPSPRGGAMFKVDRLRKSSTRPKKWKRGPIRAWDKASTSKGGAFSVGVLMGVDDSEQIWILDVIRVQLNSGDRERLILATAKQDGKSIKQWIEEEPAGAGKESAEGTVRRVTLAGYRCQAQKPSGDKELRADPLSVQVNMGNVILLEAPWNAALIAEMRFFPRSKYKDQIDSCSLAFSVLAKSRLRIGAM